MNRQLISADELLVMTHRITSFLFTSLFTFACFAQQTKEDPSASKDSVSMHTAVSKDSLQLNAVVAPAMIDSLWVETLYSSPLFEELPKTLDRQAKTALDLDLLLPTALLKERLEL